MKLMVLVLNKTEKLEDLLSEFANAGVKGATIISSTGMARALSDYDGDIPFLGSLRQMLDPEHEENKTVFTVIEDNQVESTVHIIEQVVGDLSQPDTAFVFTLPVDYTKGMHR